MDTLIKNARVLTLDEQDREYDSADIHIKDGKIFALAAGLAERLDIERMKVIDGRGLLAMPGLINAHLHSPGNFTRGALEDRPLEIFMLYEVPPLSQKPASPRLNYVRTLLGAIEMLKLGITSVLDDAFYIPVPTPETIDGLMQAYADSGMRAAASLDQPNVVEYEKYPFLQDILPEQVRRQMESAPRQTTAELVELYQYFIRRWHGSHGGRLMAAVSCSAPQRVSVDYFAELSALSKQHDLPFFIHILETKLQRVLGEKKYGKSLVRYVNDLGFLDERVEVIHAIWVDDYDIDLLGQSGCTVAHNPVCNLKLGSGVMPFRKLRNKGVPICLGTDEACVDDTINLWTVAKVAGMIHNITDTEYRNWPKAPEILQCLTHSGAQAMRRAGKVGALAPGYEADLILLDLNTLAFTPLNNLRRQLVFCENGSAVALTMVAGEVVVERGKCLTVDEEAIKAEAREIIAEYRAEFANAQRAAYDLEPYYREMYLRAAAHDIGINRWVET